MRKILTSALPGVTIALAVAAPAAAKLDSCPAPAAAVGGPSNTHTRYVEAHLLPAVIKPGEKPVTLAEEMSRLDVRASASL